MCPVGNARTSPPVLPPCEGRRLVGRYPRMEFDDDPFFGDIEVIWVPAIGHIRDLIRIHPAPAPLAAPPIPVLRPADYSDNTVPMPLKLGDGVTPFVDARAVRACRQEYHTNMIPSIRHRGEALAEFFIRMEAHSE